MTQMNEKIGYSCNPGTTTPYCTFFLLKKGERKKGAGGNALWPLVTAASDSLASLIPFSVAHDSPNGVGE
jgi:hypothetical protein